MAKGLKSLSKTAEGIQSTANSLTKPNTRSSKRKTNNYDPPSMVYIAPPPKMRY